MSVSDFINAVEIGDMDEVKEMLNEDPEIVDEIGKVGSFLNIPLFHPVLCDQSMDTPLCGMQANTTTWTW